MRVVLRRGDDLADRAARARAPAGPPPHLDERDDLRADGEDEVHVDVGLFCQVLITRLKPHGKGITCLCPLLHVCGPLPPVLTL